MIQGCNGHAWILSEISLDGLHLTRDVLRFSQSTLSLYNEIFNQSPFFLCILFPCRPTPPSPSPRVLMSSTSTRAAPSAAFPSLPTMPHMPTSTQMATLTMSMLWSILVKVSACCSMCNGLTEFSKDLSQQKAAFYS